MTRKRVEALPKTRRQTTRPILIRVRPVQPRSMEQTIRTIPSIPRMIHSKWVDHRIQSHTVVLGIPTDGNDMDDRGIAAWFGHGCGDPLQIQTSSTLLTLIVIVVELSIEQPMGLNMHILHHATLVRVGGGGSSYVLLVFRITRFAGHYFFPLLPCCSRR